MQIIICFLAPSKSGKTTASRYLGSILKKFGIPIHYISFATIYKDIAKLVGFDLAKKDSIDPKFGIRPRDFLRALGDFFRIQLPEQQPYWLNGSSEAFSTFYLKAKIQTLDGFVIIDDLRYVEEYHAMAELGAKLAYIHRKDILVDYSHSSETELFDIVKQAQPRYIDNNGTTDQLKINLNTWLDKEIFHEKFDLDYFIV